MIAQRSETPTPTTDQYHEAIASLAAPLSRARGYLKQIRSKANWRPDLEAGLAASETAKFIIDGAQAPCGYESAHADITVAVYAYVDAFREMLRAYELGDYDRIIQTLLDWQATDDRMIRGGAFMRSKIA